MSTPTPLELATDERVTEAWLRLVVPDVPCASTLPGPDVVGLAGFLTYTLAGGSAELHTGVSRPVMRVSAWAVVPGNRKPPWGRADDLSQLVRRAANLPGEWVLTVTPGGTQAVVHSASVTLLPRRVVGDAANFARYDTDISLVWESSGYGPVY